MRTMNVDLETYSATDITNGVYRYTEDPDFQILLIGYRIDDGGVKVIDLTDLSQTSSDLRTFQELLLDPDVLKTAYNANFERTCLAKWAGKRMPPEQWECTMVHAAELGLPGTLAAVGAALGLPQDKQKDKEGKALIQYFCKPCKPTKSNGGRTRNLPEHAPEKWAKFVEYNRQDVIAESAIRDRLFAHPLAESEKALWCIDQNMNDDGIRIDTDMVDGIIEESDRYAEELTQEARYITGLNNPNSISQLKTWLNSRFLADSPVESLTKDTLPAIYKDLQAHGAAEKDLRVLDIRAELGKTSVKKYQAMMDAVCNDGRLRGLFRFYGANRTGRWCLTGDHEVLTESGWVRLDNWDGGNILCWNDVSEALSFQKCEAVSFDYAGEMVTYTGKRIEQIATPDHKMAVLEKDGRWSPKEVREITGRATIPFTGRRLVRSPRLSDEIRVLIMTQADGHYADNGIIKYHFSKKRKIDRCKRLLRRAGIPFVENTWTAEKTSTITVPSQNVPLWLREFRGKTFGYWLLDEDLSVVFDELSEWDGYRCGPNSIQYSSKNEMNVDVLQACALCAGLSATKLIKKGRNEKWSDVYILNIWLTPGKGTRIRHDQIGSINYSGRVYCAKTPTGYFAVRRNGKVWITGNSGKIVQPQNLARNSLPDLDLARELVKEKNFDTLQMLFGGENQVFSELVRTAFIPSEGCRFVVSDFSAIEARVIAWLAGEDWRMKVFAEGGDIYCASASQMFRVRVIKHGENGHLRQKGKIAELALGYGGGVGAMKAMDKAGSIPEEELPGIVQKWRDASPNICKLWRTCETAAAAAISEHRTVKIKGQDIRFSYIDGILFIKLPSGRKIAYYGAKYMPNSEGHDALTYMGVNQTTKQWERIDTWGGKLVENIVQAVARDCLAETMKKVDALGYRIVMHIHDEIVVDVPKEDVGALDTICAVMGEPIDWAPGLLLRGDGYETNYYKKD